MMAPQPHSTRSANDQDELLEGSAKPLFSVLAFVLRGAQRVSTSARRLRRCVGRRLDDRFTIYWPFSRY
jgi:hypothetical protein